MDLKKLTTPPYVSANNSWLTRTLFYEPWSLLPDESKLYRPLFSLSSKPKAPAPDGGSRFDVFDQLISARDTFVALNDPTGYDWALRYLGSWDHFEALLKCDWFTYHLESWRREIGVRQTSKAIKRITEIAATEDRQSLMASKYLAEKGWEKRAGRPTKEALTGELKRQAQLADAHTEDMERIGLGPKGRAADAALKVITGGKP